MKKFVLLLSLLCLVLSGQAQNLLSGKYSVADLQKMLSTSSNAQLFPDINDRAAWSKADQKILKATYDAAEKYLDYKWEGIPATTTLLFARTGDRDEYQKISFGKRGALFTLLLAEIYENKGRFMDQIANGIWSICEESYWGVNAHIQGKLPDMTNQYVDLFAAETASLLAFTDRMLGEKLDAVSPQLRKRIALEMEQRIFTPVMTTPHGWMAAGKDGRRPNNWNPWICSNWLTAALLMEKDEARKAEMVAKILVVVDQFLNPYPQDGGCDEGPGYWNAASASLYDNLSLLNLATDNAFQYAFEDEKVRNMGRFIYRAQISEKYFLNFADASPRPGMDGCMIWRFGRDIKDEPMQQFGAWYRKDAEAKTGRTQFFRTFFELFLRPEYDNAQKGLPYPQDVWLNDLQVMVARDKEGSKDGFFVAAKGGNNDESHNHNDIGNFVVYYDGNPLLLDVGSGNYTAKTFSSRRYEIWYNRSDYHNAPTINGVAQEPGATFNANNVSYKKDKAYSQMSLNIAPSYPEQAGVTKWQRTVRLDRGKSVQITDDTQLTKNESVTEHMMTCYPAEVVAPGKLVIHYAPKGVEAVDFVVTYNPKQFEVSVDKMPMDAVEDRGVLRNWGTVNRINFTANNPKLADKYTFKIAKL